MKENDYVPSETIFLLSIYLRNNKLSQLPSAYLKELLWIMIGFYKIILNEFFKWEN